MQVHRIGALSADVQIGALTLTALSDGQTLMPATHLRGEGGLPLPGSDLTGSDLPGADMDAGKLCLPVTAFAVRGPEGCVLIDTGAGDAWHPTLGRLPDALAEAGISLADITSVALTHTHVDHLGGLVRPDGTLAFPAARVFVPAAECDLFRAEPRMAPVMAQLVVLHPGDCILPGVIAMAAPGHEIGHTAFLVGGQVLVWGDLVHHAAIQFARPGVTWVFDTDPAMARATRLALMHQAATEGWQVAGAHLPFPAIGHIRPAGASYAFAPIALPATGRV